MNKQIVNFRIGVAGLMLACFTWSCDTVKNADRDKIEPPFGGIQINGTSNSFSSTEGTVQNQETGTRITIPSDAFVLEDGSNYEGEVELKFDEYHSPSEIICSGIPMYYEGEGEKGTFTSAGMFSIDFNTPQGQKLKLKEGKNVGVDLASNVDDPNYNFYRLDETNETEQSAALLQIQAVSLIGSNPLAGRWRMLSKAPIPMPNENLAKADAAIEKLPSAPVQPQEMLDDAYKFEIDASLKKYPELEGFKGIIWQYSGDANPENDPAQNDWINAHPWDDIKIERRKGTFLIHLFSKTKEFITSVKPVFSKSDLTKAGANYDKLMKGYDETRKKKIKLVRRKSLLKQFSRAVSVSAPGTYNCDVLPRIQASNMQLVSNFDLTNAGGKKPKLFYVITKLTGNARYVNLKYNYSTADEFTVNGMSSNVIVAIFPNGKIATCDDATLKAAMESEKKESSYKIPLTASDQIISDSKDLDKVIKTLF